MSLFEQFTRVNRKVYEMELCHQNATQFSVHEHKKNMDT